MLPVEEQGVETVLKRGFDLCQDLVCLADFDGYFTWLNEAWEAELGYTREELLAKPYLEFVHPDDREATIREASRLEEGGRVWTLGNRYRRRDGSYVWLSWRATPVPEVRSILAIARNVTARRDREAESMKSAEESRRKLETLVGNLPGMVYRCRYDEARTMELVSQGAEALTGHPTADFVENGRVSYAGLVHPEDLPEVRKTIGQRVAERSLFGLRYRIRTASGEEKWVWEQGCGIFSEAGELECLEGYIVDVTGEKLAEERLREQAMLLEEANDAITVRDLDQIVTYWNKGAERLWGWPAGHAIGRNLPELLHQSKDDGFEAALETTLREGRWTGEFRQVAADGREVFAAVRWTLIRNAAGEPQSILSIADDQTEKKQLEAQLFRAQRLESIGTLASGIAHDLNNALAPILMGVYMLRRDYGERADDTIGVIENCAVRGSKLVQQVLAFGRGVEGDRIVIEMRHVIRDVASVVGKTFPQTIELMQECQGDLWPVSGDPVQLEQVVMNLLVNARDAMPNGGRIRIRCENVSLDDTYARMHLEARIGPYVVVEVSDTGCGIPPGILGRIFEPFFTTKEVGSGTGLGLSTVHSIVRSHGGFVNVYSELREGTTFKVYLPGAESGTVPGQAARSAVARGQGESILVVDDEGAVRDMASLVLGASGYRAEVARNGAEAVARFAQGGIDALVVDWSMPVMNGHATIAAVRSLAPDARILVSSGLAHRSELLALDPPVPFLAKPYTTEQLLERLASLFGRGHEDPPVERY